MQPNSLTTLVRLKSEVHQASLREHERRVAMAEGNMTGEIKRLIRKKIELEELTRSIERIKEKKLKL